MADLGGSGDGSAAPPAARSISLDVRDGVYFAVVGGDLVFLDSRNDQYFCIAGAGSANGEGLTEEVLLELREAGLLAAAGAAGVGGRTPTGCIAAEGDLAEAGCRNEKVTLRQFLALFLAAAITGAQLIAPRPAKWLRHSRRRDPDQWNRGRLRPRPEHGRAMALAASFERIRPWVPRSGRCLPASMLLLRFLKLQGLRADWVFGVRTHPFEAHCWVQHDGVVLNDSLEHVRWFTPIAIA